MGNRILRDWTDSQKVHNLSAEAERFFVRLIMKADDFGRYVGNIKLLKASLFPLHETITDADVVSWLNACISNGLLFKYQADEKDYVEIHGFNQKGLKVRKAKYPPSSPEERNELVTGYVYVIGQDLEKPVKVGFSMNPWSRLKEINANHPEHLNVLLSFKAEKRVESLLHLQMKHLRVKNEWFKLTSIEVNAIRSVCDGELPVDKLIPLLRSSYAELRTATLLETRNETEVEKETETEAPAAVVCDDTFDTSLDTKATDLIEAICNYFSVKTIVLSPAYNKVCDYVACVANRNELEIASIALQKYMAYKARSQEKVHSVTSWIGTKQNHYQDGQWIMTDWDSKNKNFIQPNGTSIKGASGQNSPSPGKDYTADGGF